MVQSYLKGYVEAFERTFLIPPRAGAERIDLISARFLYLPFEHLRGVFGLWPGVMPTPEALAGRLAAYAHERFGGLPAPDGGPAMVERIGRLLLDRPGLPERRLGHQILHLLGYEDMERLAAGDRRPRGRPPDFAGLQRGYAAALEQQRFWRAVLERRA